MEDDALVSNRLNVTDLVAARKNDIKELYSLVGSSGIQNKKRAFQSVPRVERRRAASHDPKRVPRKNGLRKQAVLENLRDNAKKRKNSKRVRPAPAKEIAKDIISIDEPVKIPVFMSGARYFDRQRDKIWLPTHVWHKKRAFMRNVSGIMVPYTATQKQYRRTYRISSHLTEHGSMAWDASHYASIIAHSQSGTLYEHLEGVFPGSNLAMYRYGSKHWMGLFRHCAPASVHYLSERSAFIQVHPAVFEDVWGDLSGKPLTLEDVRFAIGSIDVMGPQALKIITETLRPVHASEGGWLSDWMNLGLNGAHGVLPYRACMHVVVQDPRLLGNRYSGRPRRNNLHCWSNLFSSLHRLPKINVYNREDRQMCLSALESQAAIDRRVREGYTGLRDADPRIPVTLLVLDDGRIRLIMPRGCVLLFWLKIFERKRVMVGGTKELAEIALEHQLPAFPHDFAFSNAGREFHLDASRDRRVAHSRKSPSKRPTFMRDLGDPSKVVDGDLIPDVLEHNRCKIVSLESVRRGCPEPGARLFALLESEISLYADGSIHNLDYRISEDRLLGFVTSGNFGLSVARGSGIAVIRSSVEPFTQQYCLVKNLGCDSIFMMSVTTWNGGLSDRIVL